jgi:hypothetical protein
MVDKTAKKLLGRCLTNLIILNYTLNNKTIKWLTAYVFLRKSLQFDFVKIWAI